MNKIINQHFFVDTKMKNMQLESSSLSSCSSSSSHQSHQSLNMSLQCSEFNGRSDKQHTNSCESVSVCSQSPECRSPSPRRATKKMKLPPTFTNQKGEHIVAFLQIFPWYQFNSILPSVHLYLTGCVGFGVVPRRPHPPKGKKPCVAVTTAKETRAPKKGNSTINRLIPSQDIQIKNLKNVIVELQNELQSVKMENRTLKQASSPVIAFDVHLHALSFSSTLFFI